MPGREKSARAVRPVVYCIVPAELALKLHDLLRRHFGADPSVEVIVERREGERRVAPERRASLTGDRSVAERRQIRSSGGRRVADRRAIVVAVPPPPVALPRRARAYAAQLAFVERLEPAGVELEDIDTARVVSRVQSGDRDAFAVLYARYFDRVYGYLRVVLGNAHDAEDASQEVFLRVLGALHRYERQRTPFRGWLFTIVRNQALTVLSRQGRHRAIDPHELSEQRPALREESIDSALQWISDRDLVLFTERLPLVQRQVLLLRFLLDLSHAQVAEILDLTPGEVRKLQHRAIGFLRARLSSVGREAHQGRALWRRRVTQLGVIRERRFALRR
jgi:RNA polymerase sigma-70 factor (ECF subfamily)